MLGVNNVDDFVELNAFKALKNLRQIERNAKLREHMHVRAGTDHLAVDQRAITVEKNRFYLGHAVSCLLQV